MGGRGVREFWKRKRRDGTYGKHWWTNLFGVRTSTGCTDKKAAELWKRAREREGADPRHAAAESARLDDAIRDMLAELRRRGRSKAYITRAAGRYGVFVRVWGEDMPLARITAEKVNAYVDLRLSEPGAKNGTTVARATVHAELMFLRQLLELARRHEKFAKRADDILPLSFDPRNKPVERWVKFSDVSSLLEHVTTEHAAHVAFILATGARLGESYRATREDVNLQTMKVTLRGTKTKRAYRTIPIQPWLKPLMARALHDAPEGGTLMGKLFRDWPNIQRDLKGACERAGLPQVGPNDLRRSFGKWHRAAGYEPSIIAVLLGHTTDTLAQTTYATIEDEELASLIAKLGDKKGTHV